MGLVNGSTGVLKRIHYETDEPVTLHVQFDNVEEEQTIEKVSAVYESGIDEERTRQQFPVCMAFAATIHKCQGLTLDNVVVSTMRAFSAGQIFVAFSRVRNLNGLHLVDYAPLKIFADRTCIDEYNRLRTKVGMEKIEMPPYRYVPFEIPMDSSDEMEVDNDTTKAKKRKVATVVKKPTLKKQKVIKVTIRKLFSNKFINLTLLYIFKNIPLACLEVWYG